MRFEGWAGQVKEEANAHGKHYEKREKTRGWCRLSRGTSGGGSWVQKAEAGAGGEGDGSLVRIHPAGEKEPEKSFKGSSSGDTR